VLPSSSPIAAAPSFSSSSCSSSTPTLSKTSDAIPLPRSSPSSPNEVYSCCCAKTDDGNSSNAPAAGVIMAQARVSITRITGDMFECIGSVNDY